MPYSSGWVGYFVGYKPEAVVSRIWLQTIHSRACPRPDGRLHSRGGGYWRKTEIRRTTNHKLAVGGVVIHVAFRGMRLAPGVFTRGDILRFSEIGGALIERGIEVVDFDEKPMRNAVMIVAAVIVRIGWKATSEWIDPRA